MSDTYDPITAEVINMAMQDVVSEMGITVERTSGSPAATDAKDYSCVLSHTNGDTIAYYGNNLQHVGDSLTGSRALVSTMGLENIFEGDVFIYNDPYSTGSCHQCDVALQQPVFHDGELIAWVFTNIHMADIGGMSSSGFTPESRDFYSEGLRMPPMKIVEEGKDNKSLWTLVEANVRTPVVLGDIRSAIAACNVGRRRLVEIAERYGTADLDRYLRINQGLVADVLSKRIKSLPSGTYSAQDWVEYDPFGKAEFVPIVCDLTVTEEGMLTFDFSRSGGQVPGYANGSAGGILGSVVPVVLASLLPDLPVNAGVFEHTDVIFGEPGRITNPLEPAGVSGGHMETGPRCLRAAHRALSQAILVSDDEWVRGRSYALGGITAGMLVLTGHLKGGGRGYAFMLDQQALGHGALPGRDGVAYGGIDYSVAGRQPDVEVTESAGPVLYLWRREIPNSGGIGQFRGGNTLETMFVPWGCSHAELAQACAGGVVPTQGVAGGHPGGGTYTEIHRGLVEPNFTTLPGRSDIEDGAGELIPSKVGRVEISPHDGIRQLMAAGAGWGDPLARDPNLVADDVRHQRVTVDAARVGFGVVLTASSEVDKVETDRVRHEIRRSRGQSNVSAVNSGFPLAPSGSGGACGHCGCQLSESVATWRDGVTVRTSDLAETMISLGTPIVTSTEPFMFTEFSCPECSSLLDAEIVLRAN